MKKVFLFLLQLLIAILILLPVFAMNLMIDANEPVVKGLIRCVLVVMSIDVILVVLNKYARESPYVYISLFICVMSTCLMHYRLYVVSENTELKHKVALYKNTMMLLKTFLTKLLTLMIRSGLQISEQSILNITMQ